MKLRSFSLDEFHRLVDMGFFQSEDRVELLEGLLVKMSPILPAHANTVDQLPEAGDILLLIEVADITLAEDQGLKNHLYASASVPEYWIVNLVGRFLEVYQNPQIMADGRGSYLSKQTFDENQRITPLAFSECAINLQDVFS